jgi:hypothetical protein
MKSLAMELFPRSAATALIGACSLWASTLGASGQAVSVDIYVDRKANDEFLAAQRDEGAGSGFVYERPQASGQEIVIRPAAGDLMSIWKGEGTISPEPTGDPETVWPLVETAQFAPVLLVVEVTNKGSQSTQLDGAYIEVEESYTDRQPFLMIPPPADDCQGGVPESTSYAFNSSFQLENIGWGKIENAQISYSFGDKKQSKGDVYKTTLKSFNRDTSVSLLEGFKASSLEVNRLKSQKFPCELPGTSDDKNDTSYDTTGCLNKLSQSGIFGNLADSVFVGESEDLGAVSTRASGRIQFSWTDIKGISRSSSSPFWVDMPLLRFNFEGPECGAGGPVERKYKTVKLSLDKKNYRIPLPYSGKLAPQQNRRFALNLVADKSSQHFFRVVLQFADGTSAASREINLLYFLPRVNDSN